MPASLPRKIISLGCGPETNYFLRMALMCFSSLVINEGVPLFFAS